VENLGIRVRGSRFYRDHHRLSPGEWNECTEDARKCGSAFILITEKDAVKITRSPEFPLLVAVQGVRMPEETEFRDILRQVIGRRQ